jgi:drug/metabolite transporter (DMT)-like permease
MKLTRSHLMFVAMCLIWGTTWIAVKAGIAAVPPSLFAGTRFIAAGGALLCFLRWQGGAMRVAAADVPRLAVVTLLMVTGGYALLFWGMVFVNSGLSAILDLALLPIALLVLGVALGEERISRIRAWGVALGAFGIVVLFGPKIFEGHRPGDRMEAIGSAAIVMSALVYSLGSVLARPLLRTYPPTFISGATMFGGGWVLLIGSLLLEPGAVRALSGQWGAAAWLGWLFLVLFGSLVAYTIYMHLIKEWGASRAGSYAFISPAFAVLLGVAALGETVNVTDAVGMAIMLLGAWLVLRKPNLNLPIAPRSISNLQELL